MKRAKVVLVVQPYNAQRSKMLAGALDWANRHCRWDIDVEPDADHFTAASVRRLAMSGVRGLILSKASGWDVVKAIAQTPMKAVVIDTPDGSVPRPLPNVAFHDGSNSDRYVGAIGFAHFAGRGNFRHYGFVTVASEPAWSENRRDGFLAASRAAGKPCSVFEPPAGADEDRAALREWLRRMPKPCAVMGANDRTAMEILDACRQEKIAVPAALCLLGVDDNEFMCAFTKPSLSSIRIDDSANGAELANRLRDMLSPGRRGSVTRNAETSARHAEVVERDSTRAPLPAAHLIRAALDYIREHAADGIGPADVAAHLRVSRRLVELRFRELHGETIARVIRRRRLQLAADMLRTTGIRVGTVAESCGFAHRRTLERLFREAHGCSMREWRR